MEILRRYIIPRIIQWLVVIFIGISVTFMIPRLTPMNPVQTTLNRLAAYSTMNPEATEKLEKTLTDLYGLKGSILEQYIRFWRHLLKGDLGPSLTMFPTPVIKVITTSLPWTAGLLIISTLVSWGIGIFIGTLTGYFSEKKWAQALDTIIMCIYPIPYYIMALILVILFAYFFPIFPLMGGASIGVKPSFSWTFMSSILTHGFLPAISLIIIATGWRFLSQKALTSTVVASDYVIYAEAAALPSRKILFQYVMRNTLLPQITDLALSLGIIFSGALITEYVFSYPGIGQVLYTAILQGDFNLMMGITIFSIVGIATAALMIDLLYPLFDPRIRYR